MIVDKELAMFVTITKEAHPNLWAVVKHFSWSGCWVVDRHRKMSLLHHEITDADIDAANEAVKDLTPTEQAIFGSGSDEDGNTEPCDDLIVKHCLLEVNRILNAFYLEGRLTSDPD